ncbi:pyridoxal phosphate-dependent aminotransferase [Marinobacter mobilis]|uniref:Aminotransferase n=1 Tax=Marinobacter mobilis TaxID=488533 RepID=A0A1H2TK72_9GAMM|nr:pyridoxal phosphate-dependent aminotransferase [Marinobacter mobilis]SDW44262.1 aspartate aminotransferase [Marinobacter mobilis]
MKTPDFSRRVSNIKRARSIHINELVYRAKRNGRKPIVLSLGEALFDIPNYGFDDDLVFGGYHYSDSQGLPSLRKKLVTYLLDKHSAKKLSADDNVMVSMGSKALTYMSMLLALNEGDEVLLHEPAWLSYEDQAALCGASVRYIPYQCSLREISRKISGKTKVIVINNPNNPAGWVYDFNELECLISDAEKKGVFVLVDEAYSDFVGDERFQSAACLVNDYGNLIVVNSISKNLGMSGWRVGFAVADKAIIQKLTVINQHLVTCAPTMLQLYLEKNFDEIWNVCNRQIESLLVKRKKVKELLDRYGFRVLEGGATFYFFVELWPKGKNAADFTERLLIEDDVALVPGEAYGRTTSHFVRLSFGTETLERIEMALQRISARIQS